MSRSWRLDGNTVIEPDLDRWWLICEVAGNVANPVIAERARLIAAAPDLLAALRKLNQLIVTLPLPTGSPVRAAMYEAESAIAKAEGKQ